MPLNTSVDQEVIGAGGSMQVDPGSIPGLVTSLQDSLDRVGVQIEHAITELRIRPWAGDPVSTEAADEFNGRSVGGEFDALTALCGYRDQLQSAAESLELAGRQYADVEDANITRLTPGC
ncbi:hypothetical protein GIY23_19090 [Allosaccharopolyspora coralli]|uniref:PE domain-containing protein n=1 Tax=Allosaccharopolyspora coralli TaxID=2665642 RepID=A0A5Q3QII7_9PSEU|nr:hypothetical protein [Allosaccharopolyspora coralli]QGK71345.1 hypothetical protein GIY23_19090 [Allosaccharopolyspora coralli]